MVVLCLSDRCHIFVSYLSTNLNIPSDTQEQILYAIVKKLNWIKGGRKLLQQPVNFPIYRHVGEAKDGKLELSANRAAFGSCRLKSHWLASNMFSTIIASTCLSAVMLNHFLGWCHPSFLFLKIHLVTACLLIMRSQIQLPVLSQL